MFYEKPYIGQHLQGFVRPKRTNLEASLLDAFDALKSGMPLPDAALVEGMWADGVVKRWPYGKPKNAPEPSAGNVVFSVCWD